MPRPSTLHLPPLDHGPESVSLRLTRRLERIESLPAYEQRALLTTIDKFLAAAQD